MRVEAGVARVDAVVVGEAGVAHALASVADSGGGRTLEVGIQQVDLPPQVDEVREQRGKAALVLHALLLEPAVHKDVADRTHGHAFTRFTRAFEGRGAGV